MSHTALVGEPASTHSITVSRLDYKISSMYLNLCDPPGQLWRSLLAQWRGLRSSNAALNTHLPTTKGSFPALELHLLRRQKVSTSVPKSLPRRNVELVPQGLWEGNTSLRAVRVNWPTHSSPGPANYQSLASKAPWAGFKLAAKN